MCQVPLASAASILMCSAFASQHALLTHRLLLCRKTEELVSVKFLDSRRGAVDAFTQGELLNHKRLHCAHVVRLKEVCGLTVSAPLPNPSAEDRSHAVWHAAALLLPIEEAAVVLPCTCCPALMRPSQ